jgi:hypothetical protein
LTQFVLPNPQISLKSFLSTWMDKNIQIREVQANYQPLKGKLFQVKSVDNAFEYLSRAYDEGTIGLCEEFMVLLLNRANRVMGCLRLSKGD